MIEVRGKTTFVSDLPDAIGDLSTVQKLAGHLDPATSARYDRRGERATREALAVVKMAGDGPKLVVKVSRLPESLTQTIASLECFLRDVVAGLVSLISGAHEEYYFGERSGLSRPRQSEPGGNS
jgi:hypothetical protein